MKKLFFLTAFLLSFNASASLNRIVGCFSSDSKNVNVKLVNIEDDGALLGYVRYKNSQKPIYLVFSKSSEEEVGEGRPREKTITWLEIINGKVNGQYEVMSQGARYYSFIYRGNNGRKPIVLNENFMAYNSSHSDCIWE